MDNRTTPTRHVSFRSLLTLTALLLGCVPTAWATHQVSCVATGGRGSWLLSTPWGAGSNPGSVAVGQPINTAVLRIDWNLKKNDNRQAQLSLHANWTSYAKWNSAYNAMRFREMGTDAKGFGLKISDASGQVLKSTSTDPVFNHVTFDGPTSTQKIYSTYLTFEVIKLDNVTTSGPLSYFGAGFAFRPMYLNSVLGWTTVEHCAANMGFIDFGSLAVAAPPPPPPPTAACTLNGGSNINIRLPQVSVADLNQTAIGQAPAGYAKAVFPLNYSCTTSGGVVNPDNYYMKLGGSPAASSQALPSDRAYVGVKVEAVTTPGSASVVLVPGDTNGVQLHNVGAAGGSTMQLISYPVRTATGTISPGSYQASSTLDVFIR